MEIPKGRSFATALDDIIFAQHDNLNKINQHFPTALKIAFNHERVLIIKTEGKSI